MSERIKAWLRAKAPAVLLPVGTTILAFAIGGLVVAATGHNPIAAYKAIFDGSGLNYLLPWTSAEEKDFAALNLQQTLILTTPLMLTALAVALPFRCGMFNIGGQGQYVVGIVAAIIVGSHAAGLSTPVHLTLAILAAALAGAVWGGIAGAMKATVGAHEVISTIMLNWIAIYGAQYLFELNGPLQGPLPDVPQSAEVADSAKLPAVWGVLQPLHAGIFLALAMLVVYSVLINRTVFGYEVRAVGHNADAARYGGIPVARSYMATLAIGGAFAGLAGACDVLGWEFHIVTNDIAVSQVGFIGIAVALLGRNSAVGIAFAGAPVRRAPGRHVVACPRPERVPAPARRQPRDHHPGPDHPLRRRAAPAGVRMAGAQAPAAGAAADRDRGADLGVTALDRIPRGARGVAILGIVVGLIGLELALPPLQVQAAAVPVVLGLAALACALWALTRDERKLGLWTLFVAVVATAFAIWVQGKSDASTALVVNSGLFAAMLVYATPLAYAALGGIFCERSGVVNIGLEGMMLTGAFFGIWGTVWSGSWVVGLVVAMLAGAVVALVHAVFAIHLRADQIVTGTAINFLALGVTGYLFIDIYGSNGTPASIDSVPDISLPGIRSIPGIGGVFGSLNLMIWLVFGLLVLTEVILFRTPIGLRIRSVGEHPRAADTVGIPVYRIRYICVLLSGMLAALGGAYLSIGFVGSFGQNMTAGRGFIALAAVIFGKWRPYGAFGACLLFGFASGLADRLQSVAGVSPNLLNTLPYVLTLIALVGLVGRSRPPAADGQPYVKG